jgi:hypothetical protein
MKTNNKDQKIKNAKRWKFLILTKLLSKMKPENLINWGELSRILSCTRSVVTKKRMPKKYEKQVNELLAAVSKWHESLSNT